MAGILNLHPGAALGKGLPTGWLCALLLLCPASLPGQDLQLGLDRQAPRTLVIEPPGGYLRLASRSSEAWALRASYPCWNPIRGQVLEATCAYRSASERQLTFANSAGAAGSIQARLRLDSQLALGALYRWAAPFLPGLDLGLGLEERHERLSLRDGGLASAGTLDRPWLRGVVRQSFGPNARWFTALEAALPLRNAPTPSGPDYLQDLDHLGASPHPGTAATAHAPSFGLTLAVGFRFRPGVSP